jgi:hypothetical protein
MDGISLYNLPKGTQAIFKIGEQPNSKLTVLTLAGVKGQQPFSRQ